MSDEERPRKSWRDIDKQRDRSTHRRDERPASGNKRDQDRRQRTYRDKLDQLFESGRIGEVIAKQAPAGADVSEGEQRIRALRQITNAEGRDAISEAVAAYVARFELPRDVDVLAKVLEGRDPELQRQALELLLQLVGEQKPRRTRAVVGQLKLIRDTAEDPELVPLAERLLAQLD